MRKLLLLLFLTTSVFAQRGEDGLTYLERRRDWLNRVPPPRRSMPEDTKRLYLSAWLEKGSYEAAVSEGLHSLMDAFWLTGGRSHHGYLIALVLKYGSKGRRIISPEDEQAVLNQYQNNLILNSGVFEDLNPNKQMWAMVGVYLYAHFFEPDIRLPIYGYRLGASANSQKLGEQNWPTFSYNGKRYRFGSGPYNAKQLAEDYIKHQLEEWYLEGNREMDSLNYHRAFVGAMLLLYDMAPDTDLRRRARMAAELAMLDVIMDFGGSEWGGTLGRTDFSRMFKKSIFPFYEYFGKSAENTSRPDLKVLYTLDYQPPALLVDLAVLTDEPDDYFHFHKEYHNSSLKHKTGRGKWTYVTPYYNLGSNDGGYNSGWQLTVRGKGSGKFIRLWINGLDNVSDKTESRYLGNAGNQFRNALFAQIGAAPIVHEAKGGVDWDEQSTEGGWRFRRLGKVFVAIGTVDTYASVEAAIQGVDYAAYEEFKSAIQRNAALDETGYRTSKGAFIGVDDICGLDEPGDCRFPFQRMETIGKNGPIIEWVEDVMTVRYHGQTLKYDFRNWRSEGTSEPVDTRAPRAPGRVRVDVN